MSSEYYGAVRSDAFPLMVQGGVMLDVGGGVGRTGVGAKERGLADRAVLFDLFAPEGEVEPGVDAFERIDLDDHEALADACARHGPFSNILCMDVLEHLKDPWGALGVLRQHLTDDGAVVVSVPNVAHLSIVVKLLLGNWRLHDSGILDRTHLRFFTRQTARELMEAGGLTIDQESFHLVGKWSPVSRLNWLVPVIGSRYLAYQLLFRGRPAAAERAADVTGSAPRAQAA